MAYEGSFDINALVGDPSLILSVLSMGWCFSHERKMSWISVRVAVVFREPGHACERDMEWFALRSALLYMYFREWV